MINVLIFDGLWCPGKYRVEAMSIDHNSHYRSFFFRGILKIGPDDSTNASILAIDLTITVRDAVALGPNTAHLVQLSSDVSIVQRWLCRRNDAFLLDKVLPWSEAGAGARNLAPEPGDCPRGVSGVVRRNLRHDHHVLLIGVVVNDCLQSYRRRCDEC